VRVRVRVRVRSRAPAPLRRSLTQSSQRSSVASSTPRKALLAAGTLLKVIHSRLCSALR
jgi:hypothetical protein